MKDLTIKRKLILISLLSGTLALTISSVSFLIYDFVTFRDSMVQNLSTLARTIGENNVTSLSLNDHERSAKILATLAAKPSIISASIYTKDGTLFSNYLSDRQKRTVPETPEIDGSRFKENRLVLFQGIELDGRRVGTIYLQSDQNVIYDRMTKTVGIGILIFILSLLGAVSLATTLQGIVYDPIKQLTETAMRVSLEKDYSIRIPQQGKDEIGILTTQFNEMLSKIQERDIAIESAQSELENRIRRRTKALQQEVMERRQTESALRESKERYAIAIRGANDGIWDWNLKDNTIYYSLRWKTMLGYNENEVRTSPDEWFNRIHPDEREHVQTAINRHLSGASPQFEQEHRMQHKDGSYRWMLSRGLAIRGTDGEATRMAGSQTDITARKFAETQLLHDAFHDKLTALPNRTLFIDRLEGAILRAKRRNDYLFAVLLLDIDRFKVINDSLGHATGEALLIALSRRLKKMHRGQDTVARLGGDEFSILLDELKDVNDALRLTHRLKEELELPFNLKGQEVFITASIGIVLSTPMYKKADDILRDADTAMYRAKALGPGQHQLFNSGMHVQAMTLLRLEGDLRRSIGRNELYLNYQPIVLLETGQISGFEALLRWKHPERGIINPSEFIPIAEETGLIIPIGEWVFRQACQQLSEWQTQFVTFPPLTMTVNLSSKQFMQTDLISKVKQILQEFQPEPHTIGFEITESIIMDNTESSILMLKLLQDLKIRLYMDDFGTGYSSLSYIHQFPIDILKIDRIFVSRLGNSTQSGDLIETIITMAHNQGMVVVAEGVETEEQLAHIKKLGCEYGQGFLFSKPIDKEKAQALLPKQGQNPIDHKNVA